MTSKEKHKYINSTEEGNSPLEQAIRKLPVGVCSVFLKDNKLVPAEFQIEDYTFKTKDESEIIKKFPKSSETNNNKLLVAKNSTKPPVKGKRVAVLFSGGPAAGGHNVIVGLKKILGEDNTLLGIKSGPKGLLEGNMVEITSSAIKKIINTGGFDFLGSDRTKIKTDSQFENVKEVCQKNNIDALVIIGGDDSNTNAAFLAEKLFDNIHPDGRGVQVIGVPKTIDGDLQVGEFLPISFGFDTATKIYSEMVGNILQDTPSSRKYWHFVKLMGRSASHVALEVALQTKPAIALISEEVAKKKISLNELIDRIAKIVINRSKKGMNYGVVLVPEGIIEFIPGMEDLIAELNSLVSKLLETSNEYVELSKEKRNNEKRELVYSELSNENEKLMRSLPDYIEDMLLADRDAHGNLQVSLIPTEQLLIDMVSERIKELDESVPFKTHSHFFGYEGRCGMPTKFDMAFTLNLGMTAGSLILDGKTGYMASVSDVDQGGKPLAIPLTGLLTIEKREGNDEIVIEKALVETDSEAFEYYTKRRDKWAAEDRFSSPGPRQFWGPVANRIPKTVYLNKGLKNVKIFDFGKEFDISTD